MFSFFRKFVFAAILGVALCSVDNVYCTKVPALIGGICDIVLQVERPLYDSRDGVRVLDAVYPWHRNLRKGLGHIVAKGITNIGCDICSMITLFGREKWLPDWLLIVLKGLTAAPTMVSCLAYSAGFVLLPTNWVARRCSDNNLTDAITSLSQRQRNNDQHDARTLDFLLQLQRERRDNQNNHRNG